MYALRLTDRNLQLPLYAGFPQHAYATDAVDEDEVEKHWSVYIKSHLNTSVRII